VENILRVSEKPIKTKEEMKTQSGIQKPRNQREEKDVVCVSLVLKKRKETEFSSCDVFFASSFCVQKSQTEAMIKI
jgi:hypothetical protein